jgi:MFS family permease
VIYPIVFHKLQPVIGFAWATRVIGFIALAGLLVSCSVMKVKRLPPAKRALLEVGAFREMPYTLFCAALFFTFAGLYIPVFYLYSYAVNEPHPIANPDLGFYLIPMLNAASVFGRTVPSFIADTYGALNVLIPCALAAGALCLSWIAIKDVAGLIVFAILYGFFSGAFLSLPPTIVVHLSPSLRVVGTRMGMALGVGSFGLLIGTPVSGAILQRTNSFQGLQIFSGAIVFCASLLMLGSRFCNGGKKC